MKFCVFSDLHYDTIPDGDSRIAQLIEYCQRDGVELIVDLGDLCYPIEANQKILRAFEEAGISCCFSVGNHNLDCPSRKEVLDFFGLEKSDYSVVRGNVKLIFLDANHGKSPCILPEQIQWLKEEISDAAYGCIVCTHQSLANDFAVGDRPRGIVNREEVRRVLEEQNGAKGNILFCMNGHDHGAAVKQINGIWYYSLNASSYVWQSVKEVFSFDKETHEKYPYLKNMMLYREPLHAIVTVDEEWNVSVKGMEGQYLNVTPQEVGMGDSWNGVSILPRTSSLYIMK